MRKIRSLESMYRSMRRARGDGNCFFRRVPWPLAGPGCSSLHARAVGAVLWEGLEPRRLCARRGRVQRVAGRSCAAALFMCVAPRPGSCAGSLHRWRHRCAASAWGARASECLSAALGPAVPPQQPPPGRPSKGLRQKSLLCEPADGRGHPAAPRTQVFHFCVHGAAGRHQRPDREE